MSPVEAMAQLKELASQGFDAVTIQSLVPQFPLAAVQAVLNTLR